MVRRATRGTSRGASAPVEGGDEVELVAEPLEDRLCAAAGGRDLEDEVAGVRDVDVVEGVVLRALEHHRRVAAGAVLAAAAALGVLHDGLAGHGVCVPAAPLAGADGLLLDDAALGGLLEEEDGVLKVALVEGEVLPVEVEEALVVAKDVLGDGGVELGLGRDEALADFVALGLHGLDLLLRLVVLLVLSLEVLNPIKAKN